MDGAINLPLYFIRLKLKSLDRDIHYVVCCDTGRRSSAGAYILRTRISRLGAGRRIAATNVAKK